jgi:hypothetical protein
VYAADPRGPVRPVWGMKKHIRAMLDDLHRKREKGFVPTIPAPSTAGPRTDQDASIPSGSPEAVLPGDLENQELSKNAAEQTRQLDFQAQENEEREESS